MVSKKPTTQTQVSLSQDIGSNEHSRTVLDVSGSLNDAETLRARAILRKKTTALGVRMAMAQSRKLTVLWVA